jgi:hypothetical protein
MQRGADHQSAWALTVIAIRDERSRAAERAA